MTEGKPQTETVSAFTLFLQSFATGSNIRKRTRTVFQLGINVVCGWMAKELTRKFFFLFAATLVFLIFITVRTPRIYRSIPKPRWAAKICPFCISEETITPLNNTKHLLISAFMDQRVNGFDIRIIGLFRRDSIQPLYCLFCCEGHLSTTTPTNILQHSDNFGFPFVTTDVMCQIPQDCTPSHVTLLTQTEPDRQRIFNQTWLPIRNKKSEGNEGGKLQFNFTVCISNLFGDYNNVLQYAQTLEMYRMLGVDRVVIYNTSCGPDLNRLLQSYVQEGFVEMVPWPIDKHLNPSSGWLFSKYGGDVHYFGQLTTLNECIYRSMDRSRYVLLNDIDEIIMPYQHNNLMSLMNMLQQQHPKTGVFLIENHIFPKKPFEESKRGPLPRWRGVSGFNILEHIYREEPDRKIYHPHKLIIQPKSVEQTSVHEVLKMFGQMFKVPPDICRIIHSPISTPTQRPVEQLHVDTRLWDFKDQLLPAVTKILMIC
uniref:Glycosyltransferase family 92 protein n=1 Tax=Dicentrarchus labrax TaxID=13489 RepID=A0A8C4F889_DICLA